MLNNLIPPKMTTINETAQIVGLAKHYIRQLALQGKIRHVRAGKKILINIEKLIEYLNTGEAAETAQEGNIKTARIEV